MSTLADIRREYARQALTPDHVSDDPIEQFQRWFNEALDAEIDDPNAMTLATAAPDGTPSARIVLLKGVDDRGFRFYTNYDSRKGTELSQNPKAALVFWWAPLERQVRIEGTVERLSDEASTEYFCSRPRGSQLGAWASPQSRVIESRAVLEENLKAAREKYESTDPIPCPPRWGGYVVQPTQVEFWQGRPNRLHDRLRYRQTADGWVLERLAP